MQLAVQVDEKLIPLIADSSVYLFHGAGNGGEILVHLIRHVAQRLQHDVSGD